ncbi:MAG: TIGR02217 family protein, partial [Sphingomonas sp.]|nr:TIGR02217 family protein [Sphingomonas sp.]
MNHWFTKADAPVDRSFIKRFTPLHWTVDFPRGAMASVTEGSDARSLAVDVEFLRRGDLVGLIWDSVDLHSHPAQARETARDYRSCKLSFRWRSNGVTALDAVNGAVLTIEGTEGRTWYVRLWNYAVGSGSDAIVSLDFDALDGGFAFPANADRVDPKAIERMFISITPSDYLEGSSAVRAVRAPGLVTLSELACEGGGSTISVGDAVAPENGFGMATAFDDLYHRCPARVVGEIVRSGYRGTINHYVGMSHFMALGSDGLVDAGRTLCAPALAWHRSLARAAKANGYRLIWSLSFEVLAMFCPIAWQQRYFAGDFAETGYVPPSALVSPANNDAIAYLGRVAAALVAISVELGLETLFQVGEPWWWIGNDRRPALYDAAAVAAFGGSPVEIADVGGALSAEQTALLDKAGVLLAAATASVVAAARAQAPGLKSHVMAFIPGLL